MPVEPEGTSLRVLALGSRSPNKYLIPLKTQEDLYHRLMSIGIEVRYMYEEVEANHTRTNLNSPRQRPTEQLQILLITDRIRWFRELKRMLGYYDRYPVASEERKTQNQQKAALGHNQF